MRSNDVFCYLIVATLAVLSTLGRAGECRALWIYFRVRTPRPARGRESSCQGRRSAGELKPERPRNWFVRASRRQSPQLSHNGLLPLFLSPPLRLPLRPLRLLKITAQKDERAPSAAARNQPATRVPLSLVRLSFLRFRPGPLPKTDRQKRAPFAAATSRPFTSAYYFYTL